ncbi:eukaryotic translation initiation factor 4E [Exidia glandulosa HHB12029]|uniref:Eukaryotic translation initiation factor 4E n=1 Tax=Exidia glandulosa HHB12029 TaxID=1314781 RepID=A0A165IA88_EXIGL|nr:eukaryotic translation initiation factor 4E [Exidia glandulosa HHB12029]
MSYFAQTKTTTAAVAVPTPTGRPRAGSKLALSLQLGDAPDACADPAAAKHPLRQSWVFWFRQQRAPGNKIINYEEGIKRVASVSSVESFWALWTHLRPPSAVQPTTDYMLFHSGVRRPVWEDPLNAAGGKWILRLRKGVADRLWEDLIIGVIGDQFDAASDDSELCGCTISVRPTEDIISVWHKTTSDPKAVERMRDTIRRVLGLPAATVMDYKSNNDSMNDRSSFRQPGTSYDRTPLSATFDRTPLSGLQERV